MLRFSWDERKGVANLRKHGVSFQEASTVFDDPFALAIEDSLEPSRTLLLGASSRGRILVVVHIEVSEDHVRLISARRATSQERRRHEEDT